MTDRLRIGVIGLGMVSDTHLRAIADLSDLLRLTAIVSRSAKQAQARLADLALPAISDVPVFGSVSDMIAARTVDAAVILTPPNARTEIVAELTQAGIPILMEKPIARTFAEAESIVETCEAANIPLGIVFQHRFRAASLKALALVSDGKLGPLAMAEITVPWWRAQSYYDEAGRGSYARDGGGVMISQAIHTVDLALALTGPVTAVQAMMATTTLHKMESEDFAVAGLQFATGAVGSLTASTASFPGGAETIKLHFANASLRLDSGVLKVSWQNGRTETFGEEAGTGGGADPMAFTHAWHQSVIADFAQAITSGREPAITGRAALVSHVLIDAMERSSREGRIVEIDQ